MSYSKACEILGLTTPKSVTENARLAKVIRAALTLNAPLKKSVACEVLINAAR